MNTGIDIEFFEPAVPQDVKDGKLYLDIEGRNLIEFDGSWEFIGKTINVIYATEKDTHEKYTLVICVFRKSNGGKITLLINELYKGDFLAEVIAEDCLESEARMTCLTNWINHPRIKPQITFSTKEESKIIIKDFYTVDFPVTDNVTLQLNEFCGGSYRNEVVLKNVSFLKFICTNPVSRLELYTNTTAFLKLLSLFASEIPKLTALNFTFSNGRTVEQLLRPTKIKDEENALMTFDKLEPHCKIAFEIFYRRRDEFTRVMDLLISSFQNPTAEISFLNITTGFEVFHKYFKESGNNQLRQSLVQELINEGIINRNSGKWDQILRYFHLFKIAENIVFVKQNFLNPKKTICLLKDSRNYYTHYTATEKEIWTPNRLVFANRALRELLRAVILKELQIPDDIISKLLSNNGIGFYHDYENNKYSTLYLKSDKE